MNKMVLANADIPFWFHLVMYLPRYRMFVSFQSLEFFNNVTRDEDAYIQLKDGRRFILDTRLSDDD